MNCPEREILYINTDDFFASAVRLRDPTLRGRPVVVAGGGPRGMVFSASYEARAEGVRRGMSVSSARRLAPGAAFVHPDWSLFRRVSSTIFSLLRRYSPVVEQSTLDEGYLDYTGCRRLFGPVLDLGRRLKREVLSGTGLSVSIGVASSRIVSHAASKRAKRSHLVDVCPGRERDFLATIPIDRFPLVDEKRAVILRELGINLVGDVLRFGEELLSACFGFWGRRLYRGALGEDVVPVRRRRLGTDGLEVSIVLEPDRVSSRLLEAHLYRLCERLGWRLREERLLATSLLLELLYADGVEVSGRARLEVPSSGDCEIFDSASTVLASTYRRRVRVRRIGLRVLRSEPKPLQRELFGTLREGGRDGLYRALDTLRARFPRGVAPVFGRTLGA